MVTSGSSVGSRPWNRMTYLMYEDPSGKDPPSTYSPCHPSPFGHVPVRPRVSLSDPHGTGPVRRPRGGRTVLSQDRSSYVGYTRRVSDRTPSLRTLSPDLSFPLPVQYFRNGPRKGERWVTPTGDSRSSTSVLNRRRPRREEGRVFYIRTVYSR